MLVFCSALNFANFQCCYFNRSNLQSCSADLLLYSAHGSASELAASDQGSLSESLAGEGASAAQPGPRRFFGAGSEEAEASSRQGSSSELQLLLLQTPASLANDLPPAFGLAAVWEHAGVVLKVAPDRHAAIKALPKAAG